MLLAWPDWPGNENQAFFNNFSVEVTLEIPVPAQSYTVGISSEEDARRFYTPFSMERLKWFQSWLLEAERRAHP